MENQTILADGSTELAEVLPAMVELGLQKSYGYQHNDGGWGWWYDDSSNDFQSYVLFGMTATQDAGNTADDGVNERLCVGWNVGSRMNQVNAFSSDSGKEDGTPPTGLANDAWPKQHIVF